MSDEIGTSPTSALRRVLVIEPDELLRGLILEWLAIAGYEAAAVTPEQALAADPNEHVSLVIVDLFLPRRRGVETVRDLRAARAGSHVLALSAQFCGSLGGSAEAARRLGADHVLAKPFSRRALIDAVCGVLRLPAGTR